MLKDKRRTIIMGDLNALAVQDVPTIDPKIEKFYINNPSLIGKLEPALAEMRKGTIIRELTSSGLIDAGSDAAIATFPSKLFDAQFTGTFLRLDYCLHTPSVMVNNFTVHSGGIYNEASDYLPITFEV